MSQNSTKWSSNLLLERGKPFLKWRCSPCKKASAVITSLKSDWQWEHLFCPACHLFHNHSLLAGLFAFLCLVMGELSSFIIIMFYMQWKLQKVRQWMLHIKTHIKVSRMCSGASQLQGKSSSVVTTDTSEPVARWQRGEQAVVGGGGVVVLQNPSALCVTSLITDDLVSSPATTLLYIVYKCNILSINLAASASLKVTSEPPLPCWDVFMVPGTLSAAAASGLLSPTALYPSDRCFFFPTRCSGARFKPL